MKQLIAIILMAFACACNNGPKPAGESPAPDAKAKFAIQEEIHNFGSVQAGEMLSYSFKFTNEGDVDLLITKVETDCGCLHINYPEEPVKPGESSYIEVLLNTAGEVGQVLKQISVYTNAQHDAKSLIIGVKVENELFNLYN